MVSWGCLEGVWGVSEGCLGSVWGLLVVSGGCWVVSESGGCFRQFNSIDDI